MAVAHNRQPAKSGPAFSLGRAMFLQRQQSGLALWELGQALRENPDSLRALERGKRPITKLARRLIRHFEMPTAPLARQLQRAAEAEVNAFPPLEQCILWDAFLLTVRRHTVGGSPVIRLEEHGDRAAKVSSRKARGSSSVGRVQPPASSSPRLHVLASATS